MYIISMQVKKLLNTSIYMVTASTKNYIIAIHIDEDANELTLRIQVHLYVQIGSEGYP